MKLGGPRSPRSHVSVNNISCSCLWPTGAVVDAMNLILVVGSRSAYLSGGAQSEKTVEVPAFA
ncbi:MAG: hypothetical protein RIS36_30 [Pseudomonadota bacterium]|jgi:hypothetical protein